MGLFYTNKKIFHFKDKIDSLPRQVDKIRAPLHIRIKPTNVCNHNCSYCAYRVKNLQLGQDMNVRDSISLKKMMEIIEDIITMDIKAVTFSGGGDPFCYPHLLDVAMKLSQSPIKFASLTNGARLTGEVSEVFAHHATWLRISMDGWDDESYTRYRGCGDGEFSKIMGNMENFKRHGGNCYLGVSLIVDRNNANHIYDFVRRIKDAGVDSVKISGCVVSNSGKENNEYHLPVSHLVKEQTQRVVEELSDQNFEVFDSYHNFEDDFTKKYAWCPFIQVLTVIGADLNVYSCQDKAYNLSDGLIGSIRNIRFKKFWNDGKRKFFRINPSHICDHHCVSNQKNLMILDYLAADPEHLGFV